jgi:hypothetical protein
MLSGLQREALDRGIQDAEYGSSRNSCHDYVRVAKRLGNCSTYTPDVVDQYVRMAEEYLNDYERADNRESRDSYLETCEQSVRMIEDMISGCRP